MYNEKISVGLDLLKLLESYCFKAYIVGGSVRDILLNREIKDIDIATNAHPEEIEFIANSNNIKFIPTGLHHGTVTLIFKNLPIQITTFRKDKECDGRHAKIEYSSSIYEDISRRDFTINAMAMNHTGQIIDLFCGVQHLKEKTIQTVGSPTIRFIEDELRAMRAIRFATQLNFSIDHLTYSAIKNVNLNKLSFERIRDELILILESPNRTKGIELLDNSNILIQILPEVTALKGVNADAINHPEIDTFLHTMMSIQALPHDASLQVSLSTLLHDIGKAIVEVEHDGDKIHFLQHETAGAELAEKILCRLKFPAALIDNVKWLVANHMRLYRFDELRTAKKIRLINEPLFNDLLELYKADNANRRDNYLTTNIENFIANQHKQKPLPKVRLITGNDLLTIGMKPSKELGDMLILIEDEIIEGKITTRDEAIKYAKELFCE